MKDYRLILPVFKQGSDMNHAIDSSSTLADAFKLQADVYKDAAAICQRMASVAVEYPNLSCYADTHMISLAGPEAVLQALAGDGVVAVLADLDDEVDDFQDILGQGPGEEESDDGTGGGPEGDEDAEDTVEFELKVGAEEEQGVRFDIEVERDEDDIEFVF